MKLPRVGIIAAFGILTAISCHRKGQDGDQRHVVQIDAPSPALASERRPAVQTPSVKEGGEGNRDMSEYKAFIGKKKMSDTEWKKMWFELAQADFTKAIAFLGMHEEMAARRNKDSLEAVFDAMGDMPVKSAWGIIKDNCPENRKMYVADALLQHLVEVNPEAAIDGFAEISKDIPDPSGLSRVLSQALLRLEITDRKRMMSDLMTNPELSLETRREMANELTLQSSPTGLDVSRDVIEIAASDAMRDIGGSQTISRVVDAVQLAAFQNTDTANAFGEYLSARFGGDSRFYQPMLSYCGNWALKEPITVSEFLTNMPAGVMRDYGIAGFVQALRPVNPDLAERWLQSISDNEAKRAAISGSRHN